MTFQTQTAPQKRRYFPPKIAARKMGITLDTLTKRLGSGNIDVALSREGEILVAAEPIYKTKEQIIKEEFSHLKGRAIGVSEAAKKYDAPIQTLARWVKLGYIHTIFEPSRRGQKKLIDEADAAYCAKIYAQKYKEYKGRMQGVSVFDKDGNPYQLKYAAVAKERRQIRRQARQTAAAG